MRKTKRVIKQPYKNASSFIELIFCANWLFFMLGLLQMWKGWRNSCITSTNQDQVCLLKCFQSSFIQGNKITKMMSYLSTAAVRIFFVRNVKDGMQRVQTESDIMTMKCPLCLWLIATFISPLLVLKATECPCSVSI